MVAIKAHQANSFLSPPGPKVPAVLFYGTDAGLVAERAQKLAALVAGRDSGEIVRFDDTDLDADPDRLAVELQTIPMFGGSKVVRASAGRRITAAALQPLLDGGTLAATLIVEAGNLKPTNSMRALFEKSPQAAAVACYADEAADLEGLIRETLKAHGLDISSDARELLVARMGADRGLSRGELEKLALFATGKRQIEAANVEAIVGDASASPSTAPSTPPRPAARPGPSPSFRARSPPGRARRRSSPRSSAPCSDCIASVPTSMPARRSRTPSVSSARRYTSSRRMHSACSAACGPPRGWLRRCNRPPQPPRRRGSTPRSRRRSPRNC